MLNMKLFNWPAQVKIGKDTFSIADNFTLASPVINSLINGEQQIFQVLHCATFLC